MKLLFVFFIIYNFIYLNIADDCPYSQDTQTASATYYTDINGGNCGFGDLSGPTAGAASTLMIAALNTYFYDSGKNCGQCFEIFSPYTNQSVLVVATDQCPGGEHCSSNNYHFDLSPQAFDILGQRSIGVLNNLKFYKSPCQVKGNLKVMMKDGSNDNWTAFLIFNNQIGVKKVSVKLTGSNQYKELSLATYNYWISPDMTVGEFELRIESLGGEFIYLTIPKVESLKIYDSNSQFTTEGCTTATSSLSGENPSSSSKLLPSFILIVLYTIYLFI